MLGFCSSQRQRETLAKRHQCSEHVNARSQSLLPQIQHKCQRPMKALIRYHNACVNTSSLSAPPFGPTCRVALHLPKPSSPPRALLGGTLRCARGKGMSLCKADCCVC